MKDVSADKKLLTTARQITAEVARLSFKFYDIYKSGGSFLVWRIQVCVNSAPRRKDMSSYLRQTAAAVYKSEKSYLAISKNL